MPIIETYHNRIIDQKLIEEDKKNQHIPSGKLSASKLGWALQWQVLYSLATGAKEIDAYTLRKFQRGKDVEDRILSFLPTISKQEFVQYRNVVGYMDALEDTKDWDFPVGTIPVEIKSVTNLKFKKLQFTGAQKSHILQAALYALAKGTEHFAVVYVASDDYRIATYVLKTEDYKKQIDAIIDAYDHCIKNKMVPVFQPMDTWHIKKLYNPFPDWMDLDQDQIVEKLQNLNIEFK